MTPRRLIEPARLAGTPLLRTQSDARLVDLVRAGHAAAFEAIVQRYRRPLLKYCSRLLPASRAEDAVQQTFLKAYQSMVSGDAEINLRPWLYKIAHNSALNLLRQNGWNYDELDENFDGVQRPDQALEVRERLQATVKAVKKLPERQRDAVLLREVEGLSYEEIGAALGVGDGAVRQLLHRARATLRAGATAVMPVGLVERAAMALQSGASDPATRVAEAAAGISAGAGAIKLGAAVLATGAIATGVSVSGPLTHHSHRATAEPVAEKPAAAAAAGPIAASTGSRTEDVSSTRSHHGSGKGKSGHGKSGSGRHGHRGHDGSGDSSGPGPSDRRRGSDGRDDHSGSGGSGGSGDRHSGSGDRRSGSGDSDDGSGDRHGGSGSGSGPGSGSGEIETEHSGSTTTSDDGGQRHGGDDGLSGGGTGESGSKSGSGGGDPTTTTPLPTTTSPMDTSGSSHDGGG